MLPKLWLSQIAASLLMSANLGILKKDDISEFNIKYSPYAKQASSKMLKTRRKNKRRNCKIKRHKAYAFSMRKSDYFKSLGIS